MVEKLKNYYKNYFSNGPKAIFVVMLILMITASVAFGARKTITVSIDGNNSKITTFSSTYRAALNSSKIKVGPKDKTTPSLDSKIQDGSTFSIKRAVNLEVDVDGKKLKLNSAEDNVEKMLEAENIAVKDYDKVSPSKTQSITDGMVVVVTRVETKDIKENKSIDYSTVKKNDDSIAQGNNKILQNGKNGQKEITIRVIYEDGKEVARKIISEIVTQQPVTKIVAMGTLGVLNPSRGGQVLYTKSIKMRATAYAGGTYTASGTIARRNSSGYSSVSVDPRIIPLGTKLYVEGYGYAVAEDTGGAIKGNTIDVYYNNNGEANSWGVKYVNVYVIK
jgi:uncharacterized protein YabE (DUF348 family)